MTDLIVRLPGADHRLSADPATGRDLVRRGDDLVLAQASAAESPLGYFTSQIRGWYFHTPNLSTVYDVLLNGQRISEKSTAIPTGRVTIELARVTPVAPPPLPDEDPLTPFQRWKIDHRTTLWIGVASILVGVATVLVASVEAIHELFH